MMQMIVPGTNLRYNPQRDIVNLFTDICRQATTMLDDQFREPWLQQFLDSSGITQADLVDAANATAHFINAATSRGFATLEGVIEDAGLNKLKRGAMMALMMRIGQSACAAYFHYARESLADGAKPHGFDMLADSVSQIKY